MLLSIVVSARRQKLYHRDQPRNRVLYTKNMKSFSIDQHKEILFLLGFIEQKHSFEQMPHLGQSQRSLGSWTVKLKPSKEADWERDCAWIRFFANVCFLRLLEVSKRILEGCLKVTLITFNVDGLFVFEFMSAQTKDKGLSKGIYNLKADFLGSLNAKGLFARFSSVNQETKKKHSVSTLVRLEVFVLRLKTYERRQAFHASGPEPLDRLVYGTLDIHSEKKTYLQNR